MRLGDRGCIILAATIDNKDLVGLSGLRRLNCRGNVGRLVEGRDDDRDPTAGRLQTV